MKNSKSNYKILSPKIPKQLDKIQSFNNNIENYDSFYMKIICNCSIENQTAEHINFKQIIFKDVFFKQISFQSIDLTDIIFENCDLSNVDFRGAIIHRTKFIHCKILGIKLNESTLQNVIFENCNGEYAYFTFSHCKQVNFQNCLLYNSNFQECTFNKVNFLDCDLKQAEISGTKLKGIDLSTCEIEGIGVRIEDLYGVTVSPMQSIALSKLLGLIIKI